MRNARMTMGNFGASTRPIAFAPEIKSQKETILKAFRDELGRKGYTPAEAAKMAENVRSKANALAIEVNARQKNDDPVKMADISIMALKMKIDEANSEVPFRNMEGTSLGRLSKVSPMSVSLADRGKDVSADSVRKRGEARRAKSEAKVLEMYKYRKARGKLKDNMLNQALRASYMQQFNGAMGHYGTMGFKLKKPAFIAKVQKSAAKVAAPVQKVAAKVAAPVQKVAAVVAKPVVQASKFTAQSAVRAATIVKKDPIGAIAKVTVGAPLTLVASIAPANTVVGKAARAGEKAVVQGFKFSVSLIQKVLDGIKELVLKALAPVANFFKKAWDGLKSNVIDRVAARFTGKGTAGFGSLPEDEKKKLTELTADFAAKKALEAAGVEATILGTAAATGTATATATVTTAAAASGPAAPATAAAAAAPAAAAGAAAATPTATAATTAYIAKLTDEGVNDVAKEFAKYKAAKQIPNPIVQKVVNAGIDGKIPTNTAAVKQMAAALPQEARKEFVQAVTKAPEAAKQEIIKKAIVPQEFKKTVEFIPAEAKKLAESKPAIPQIAIAESMQKAYAKNPEVKDITPAQAKAEAAKGVLVQDQLAVDMVKEGKLNTTQAIVASSKIGKEAAIAQLPPEAKKEAVKEIKKEMSAVENARIEQKVESEKAKSTAGLWTAAAIAAKVLIF